MGLNRRGVEKADSAGCPLQLGPAGPTTTPQRPDSPLLLGQDPNGACGIKASQLIYRSGSVRYDALLCTPKRPESAFSTPLRFSTMTYRKPGGACRKN